MNADWSDNDLNKSQLYGKIIQLTFKIIDGSSIAAAVAKIKFLSHYNSAMLLFFINAASLASESRVKML